MPQKQTILLIFLLLLTSTSLIQTNQFKPEQTAATLTSQTAKIHNLNTRLNYTTIQEAINDTKTLNGHTILAEAGTYYENILINKAITLEGEDKSRTVIHGSGIGPTVQILTDNTSIFNFTIANSGNAIGDAGIKLTQAHDCTITGNNLKNNSNGIMLAYAANNTIRENFIQNSTDSGISVYSSNDNTLNKNGVNDSGGYGIFLQNSTGCSITENTITRSIDDGIAILNSHRNLVQCNVVTNGQAEGIRLDDPSNNNIITENTVANNTDYGFWMWYSNNNTFTHNNCNNKKTVQIWTVPPVYDSVNKWDNDYPSGGNYWSNYNGTDIYSGPHQNQTGSDGIGDTPYVIDDNNTDNYPLMGKFTSFTISDQPTRVISNCTINSLHYFQMNNTIAINVSNSSTTQTTGFCRISIPKTLMQPPYTVKINNGLTETLRLNSSIPNDSANGWIYFTYPTTTHAIAITGTAPSTTPPLTIPIAIIIAVIIAAALFTGGLIYAKRLRQRRRSVYN